MSIVQIENIKLASKKEQQIRSVVSLWANSIPYHPYQDFGDKINIKEIVSCPIYELVLFTQYYSQVIEPKMRPYKGEPLNYHQPDTGSKIPFGGFIKDVKYSIIPGSEQVAMCKACRGAGEVICSTCNGKQSIQCSTCSGRGEVNCSYCYGQGMQSCWQCSGMGRVYKSESQYVNGTWVNVSGNVRCGNCGGYGKVKCSNYSCRSGRVQCSYCYGKGVVTCTGCQGRGKLRCKPCDGSGKVVFYEQKTRKWDYNIIKGEVYHPTHHRSNFPNFKLNDNLKRVNEDEHLSDSLSNNHYSNEPDNFYSVYKSVFKESFSASNVNVDHDVKILFQKIKTNSISAFLLHYEYEGENYSMLAFEKNNTVYEENGPIAKVKQAIKSKGKKHYKYKNFGASHKQLSKAKEMDPSEFDADLSNIFNKVQKKIRSSYWVGSFVGLFAFGYFLLLSYLNGFHSQSFLYSWLGKVEVSEEFILGSGTGFFLLYLLFVIPLISYQNRILYNKFGTKISPEIFRVLLGFIFSILASILSTLVVLLIHKIGIIEPIGTFFNEFFE